MTKLNNLYELADELDQRITAIVKNPKYKSDKQNNIRIRLAWKEIFSKYDNFDDILTENIFRAFCCAVGYTIDGMALEDTLRFIDYIIYVMKEVSSNE